jgi:hypothetical protein
MQDILGPLEHRDFVKEVTQISPMQGTAVMAAAPIYTFLKKIGLIKARSNPSTDEIFRAWEGYLQGLKARKPENLLADLSGLQR